MKELQNNATVPFTAEELRRCVELLEAIVADRAVLAELTDEQRRQLLTAAGRISRPQTHEERRLVKAFRRGTRKRRQRADRETIAQSEIRVVREAPVFVAPGKTLPAPVEARELQRPRHCYVCKTGYTRLHFFYDSMCETCAEFNYQKRFQSAPLGGKVALITGARVKIGYHCALKMLRAGARVIVTTRFPHDAAQRYAREEDFPAWKDRLQIHGLDLRHSPSVELFTRFLNHTLERLDILINNACQTVRRPPNFYAHLLDFENTPVPQLPAEVQALLRDRQSCIRALGGTPLLTASAVDNTGLAAWHGGGSGVGLVNSAQLSQLPYSYDETARRSDLFPEGRTDADLQQVDLRAQNSWRLTLGEVPTPELLEVQLVNAIAPFVLCGKLKPLMLRTPNRDKHIVNVSAMEGIFSRGTKTEKHPHTNMAKAALNMLTLTSARDYVESGIHMNAVDTGWVTDEDPALHAQRKKDELNFQPPLDIVDGAARVCDPFFFGLISGEHAYGKFFKDYKASSW